MSESKTEFSTPEPTEFGIPAFLRREAINNLHTLRKRMEDPGGRGGTFSPINPFGIQSRLIKLSDVSTPARDHALDIPEITCLTGQNNTSTTAVNLSSSQHNVTLVDRDYKRHLVVKEK